LPRSLAKSGRSGSDGFVHLFDCNGTAEPGFEYATQRRNWNRRQQNHRAIGMNEKSDLIAGLEVEMLSDGFGNCHLTFDGEF
jgi:hypothetical protein